LAGIRPQNVAALLNMVILASLIEKKTGVNLRIVGFDTGRGLPPVQGYKDHPELWNPGDFAMEDRDSLMRRIGNRAEILWGDIVETIDPFTDSIDPTAPLGFIGRGSSRRSGNSMKSMSCERSTSIAV
jgi:hypothetical protein